jgi:hypothetical protein
MSQPPLKRRTLNQPTLVELLRGTLATAGHMETRAGRESREKILHEFDCELLDITNIMVIDKINNDYGSDKYTIATVRYQSELNDLMATYGLDQH